tara:strand:+ start:265 stop:1335 length:1071 start_codon:yes stop_codon:yes gene_type:complete
MAYSQTIGTTVISVQKLIDHGANRAGKLAEELTSEQVLRARESLFYVLSSLINIGIQYWAIEKKIYGLKANQYIYDLPVGGNDVLNVLYRRMSRPTPNDVGSYSATSGIPENAFDSNIETKCIQTAPNGSISVDYGLYNPVYVGSIGVLPGVSGSFNVLFEYSSDGITWKTLYGPGVTAWVENEWLWYDIDPGQNVQYYRMRETGGNTLNVCELYFGNNSTEIPMARLNRDDYTSLPNKYFTANQPFQFWFDRTIPQSKLYLWPVPSSTFVQMVAWYSRQIMDVGDLSGELEIPQRWYMAIQSLLAHQMALELPGVDMQRIQYLEDQANKHLILVEQEERDKSPIYLAPNIGVYTR